MLLQRDYSAQLCKNLHNSAQFCTQALIFYRNGVDKWCHRFFFKTRPVSVQVLKRGIPRNPQQLR